MGNYFSKSYANRSGGVGSHELGSTVSSGEATISSSTSSSPAQSSSSSSLINKRKRPRLATETADDDDDDESNQSSSSSSSSSSDNESSVDELQTSINLMLNYSQTTPPDSSKTKNKSVKTFSASVKHQQPSSKSLSIRPELIKPSRKKMKSTSNYIYNALFVNGENSDICVRALNREWHLHKLYLCQSPYFESMFKDSQWRESNERFIDMSIPDSNISERALEIALGSFYREEIHLVPIEVIAVLACASLFSLEGLIGECESVMLDNINAQTVLAYYDAALLYGVGRVADKCVKWLALNLMICEDIRLDSIGLALLDKTLSCVKHLMIIQVETDLYSLCKKWLFYQLMAERTTSPIVKLDSKTWQKTTNEFFKSLLSNGSENGSTTTTTTYLLENEIYLKYVGIFKKIRMQSIVNDLQSLRLIIHDRIVPLSWLEPYFINNWMNLLFVDQDRLSVEFDVDAAEFDNSCLRFGRVLNSDSPGTWRWIGFNYGIDLLMTHTNRTLGLKRNTSTMHSPYKGLLSNRQAVRFYYVIKIVELDANGNEVWSKRTELTCFDMHKNEEKNCLIIEAKVKYPILLNLFVSFCPFRLNYLNQAD